MGYFDTVRHVVQKADIVLLVVDARMPELARNNELEGLVRAMRKVLVIVFNKVDLISQNDLTQLRNHFKNAFFVSASKNEGISKLRTQLYIIAKQVGIDLPHVGVVGYPNTGKSALINVLARGARTKVSSVAGTTKGVQWVRVGKLRVIDSPGVITYKENEEKLGFIGAKNPEQIQNPESVACEIIDHCIEKNRRAFEEFYEIEVDGEDEEDLFDVLLMIGKKRGYLAKGGIVDEKRTAIAIIRDWQKGKLKV
jgi:ribosome biogenesis GTPase A